MSTRKKARTVTQKAKVTEQVPAAEETVLGAAAPEVPTVEETVIQETISEPETPVVENTEAENDGDDTAPSEEESIQEEQQSASETEAEEVQLESAIKPIEPAPVVVPKVAKVVKHSTQYFVLEGKLNDYCAQVKKAGKYNEKALIVCMHLFNDIVLYVLRYPFKENVELLFKTVVENKATVFSGTTLMAGINKLTETEQLRFGAFCTVLLQLADKKLKNLRITYSREAIALQLRNDTLVQALEAIRSRLEQ